MATRCRLGLCGIVIIASTSAGCALSDRVTTATSPGVVLDVGEEPQSSYDKSEHMIPMRDGARLFTAVYTPSDTSRTYPILMVRTPYSCSPYGEDEHRKRIGPNEAFERDGYIFVYQDVRGCYMSEGEFVNMTPHIALKQSDSDVDESTDTYDTVEWLLENIANHNGRVGQWGISYPGFYAAAGMIDHHPALVAVSPQAPIADWWFDDFHHHGALFLPHAFNFLASFGRERPEPTTERSPRFDHGTPDGYQFFLDLGPLRNANEHYLEGEIGFWNDIVAHPNYDEFWQRMNILPHLDDVAPAVLVVGGWFDAEDLYGPLAIYQEIEHRNPDVRNNLVMGPWRHGGWLRGDGSSLGDASFGGPTSEEFQREVLQPFFAAHLQDGSTPDLAEATMFETGVNRWRHFDAWPPARAKETSLFLHAGGGLQFESPASSSADSDSFVSDPTTPVPFTTDVSRGMTRAYMSDDQRFAVRRPDVLVYETDVLGSDVTLAGSMLADLWVSTSETDADWVVKLIDVFPPDAPDHEGLRRRMRMGNYHMMVRSEVLRGRFRDSYEHPAPFEPNQPTRIRLPLQDVLHTFQGGHRIMIQIQSTWFPLVDRNPQRYVENIFLAEESDFVAATHRVYTSSLFPSALHVRVLGASTEVEAGDTVEEGR